VVRLDRFLLVAILSLAFLGTVTAALLAQFFCDRERRKEFRDLLNALLPVETALLGAAAAYYFAVGS
jgi:predicted membrane protein